MIPTRALLLQRLLHSAASVGGIALLIATVFECSLSIHHSSGLL